VIFGKKKVGGRRQKKVGLLGGTWTLRYLWGLSAVKIGKTRFVSGRKKKKKKGEKNHYYLGPITLEKKKFKELGGLKS